MNVTSVDKLKRLTIFYLIVVPQIKCGKVSSSGWARTEYQNLGIEKKNVLFKRQIRKGGNVKCQLKLAVAETVYETQQTRKAITFSQSSNDNIEEKIKFNVMMRCTMHPRLGDHVNVTNLSRIGLDLSVFFGNKSIFISNEISILFVMKNSTLYVY